MPEWPDLNYLYLQLIRAPRVDHITFDVYDDPPRLDMIFYRKGTVIGSITLFKDRGHPRTCVFGNVQLAESERKQGTFSALCVGMLKWFDRGYFKRLTSRGRLSESLEPRLHAIGLEPLYDPVADATVLGSDLTNKDSLLHKKLNEWERTHKLG